MKVIETSGKMLTTFVDAKCIHISVRTHGEVAVSCSPLDPFWLLLALGALPLELELELELELGDGGWLEPEGDEDELLDCSVICFAGLLRYHSLPSQMKQQIRRTHFNANNENIAPWTGLLK